MKKLLCVLLFVAGCGEIEDDFKIVSVDSSESAIHSWGGYHWRSDHLSPTVYNKTPSTLYDVSGTVLKWSSLNTPIQPAMSLDRKADISVSESSSIFWLGIATIYLDSSGHIVKGDVKLNTRLLKKYSPAVAAHVLCQELGHIWGLDHNEVDTDTCMNDLTAVSSPWLYPNAHDTEELNLIYNHTD